MTRADQVAIALHEWAPELAETFISLAYLGGESSTQWLTDSEWATQLESLASAGGHATTAEMWRKVLKERINLPAPALLLMLEHLRRHPSAASTALAANTLEFSKTLANVAFRAADSLHEGAKSSFAGEEIDISIARFRAALSEFRFSIESHRLTDQTKRIATGKYASAVAMVGRWVNLPPDTVSRALLYSEESMTLGNLHPETVAYRLELLLQRYDQTGNNQLLHEAQNFAWDSSLAAGGSDLAQAEAKLRLAQLSDLQPNESDVHLGAATLLLARFHPRNAVEEARATVLYELVAVATKRGLPVPATSAAIPRGLLALMTTKPSSDLWQTIRGVIKSLEDLRIRKGSIPAAGLSVRFLRQIVEGPSELLEQRDLDAFVDISYWLAYKASWNRHLQWEAGAAALSAANRSGNKELARDAQRRFGALAVRNPTWPLPRIGVARVHDYLRGRTSEDLSEDDNWRYAAELALNSAVYARSTLGGHNEVFAITDARGFLSETFVFKRTTKAKAEHEAAMLRVLRSEIDRRGLTNRFEVPRSLAIVAVPSDDERRWVHVSQRTAGQLVSELRADEASGVIDSIVDLLVVFHSVAGSPPPGKSAWRSLKDYLKMWSRTLFEPVQAERFVDSLRDLYPSELPLVRKRDGHASNWLVDTAGRVVAIDLESSDFVPLGYDISLLLEDNALVQANADGWRRRLALMNRYLSGMGHVLEDSAVAAAYGWFAITRALRLGTEREAGKHLRRHARELSGMLMECASEAIKGLAQELLHALSRVEQSDSTDTSPTHDHRRLSKSMAFLLRHHGPSKGVPIDGTGFASLDDLAITLEVDTSQLLAVAEHPGEPRFEIRDGRIRALYGHSLNVFIDTGINVGAPNSLYHGSSWSTLDAIMRDGLTPMRRQMVHLTNNSEEAIAVGMRKGAPLVFAVDQSHEEEPVAEGIWVAKRVPSNRLSIVNPYIGEAGVAR